MSQLKFRIINFFLKNKYSKIINETIIINDNTECDLIHQGPFHQGTYNIYNMIIIALYMILIIHIIAKILYNV